MGGSGSGTKYGRKKLTLNDLPAIDAAVIKVRLREGHFFTMIWDNDLRLSFRADGSTLHALDIGQRIEVERTACHFGASAFGFAVPTVNYAGAYCTSTATG